MSPYTSVAVSLPPSTSKDLKTLLQWMSHDALELPGLPPVVHQELFDLVVAELKRGESKEHPNIGRLK